MPQRWTAHRLTALTFALAATLLATTVEAAKAPVVRGVIFKGSGEFEPVRVGLDKFTLKDSDDATAGDYELAHVVSEVVFNDLDFSYLFEPVRPDTLYMRIMGFTEIDQRGWRHLGAEYLIQGEVQANGEELAVEYTLRDIINDRQVFQRRLKSRRSTARLLAHTLSDEVYQEIARTPGIFQTRLTYLHSNSPTYKEVHVCDYDGANDIAVTADRAVVISPRWADANTVSYTSFRDGNPDVWLLDLSRDRAQKLSARPGLNSGCAWSRDGKRYVLSLSVDGDPEIYIGQEGSNKTTRLTFSKGIDSSPSFSPDGKRIIFTSDRGGTPQIYIMDEDGANVERLTRQGHYNESPDWSPTLDVITYVTRIDGVFQIHTIRPDGTGIRQLTEVGSNENPHWSPDGMHIVFTSNRTGEYEIYTMNYDGSGVRRLTTNGNNTNPAWSP
ncbi:MAG: Tol-Pal system beta propeller repeat protein TolB [Candidatus Zixiibacteriota bacterium]